MPPATLCSRDARVRFGRRASTIDNGVGSDSGGAAADAHPGHVEHARAGRGTQAGSWSSAHGRGTSIAADLPIRHAE
jgi:hypothetical protein